MDYFDYQTLEQPQYNCLDSASGLLAMFVSSVHAKLYAWRNPMAAFLHSLCMYGVQDFGTMDIRDVDVSGSTVLSFSNRVCGMDEI